MLSFGHAAFLGTGSYLCGIAIVIFGWPWWAAIAARRGRGDADRRGHRLPGDPHARHLLLDGYARARADRLLRVLQGRALDRRRERPARRHRRRHQRLRLAPRLRRSDDQVLRDPGLRRGRPVVRLARAEFAVRRRDGSDPREREARPAPAATTSPARSCWSSRCPRPSAASPAPCARCTCRSCRSTRCTTCSPVRP